LKLKSLVLGLAGITSAAHAGPAQYPLLDGRCDEYRRIGAEVTAESDRWWKVHGWWSNAVSWNRMQETEQCTHPNFQACEGRELQLSKSRFGRGIWRLKLSIGSARDAGGGMKWVVIPPKEQEQIVVDIF
jgi:hypothetical protein